MNLINMIFVFMNICSIGLLVACLKIYQLDKELVRLTSFCTAYDLGRKYDLQHDNYLQWMNKKGKNIKDIDQDIAMVLYMSGKRDAIKEVLSGSLNEIEKIINGKKQ